MLACRTGASLEGAREWCPELRGVFCCSGASLEAKNLDGKTALEVAELNEQADIVELVKAFKKDGEAKPAAAAATSS